jgi:hypothetical protein
MLHLGRSAAGGTGGRADIAVRCVTEGAPVGAHADDTRGSAEPGSRCEDDSAALPPRAEAAATRLRSVPKGRARERVRGAEAEEQRRKNETKRSRRRAAAKKACGLCLLRRAARVAPPLPPRSRAVLLHRAAACRDGVHAMLMLLPLFLRHSCVQPQHKLASDVGPSQLQREQREREHHQPPQRAPQRGSRAIVAVAGGTAADEGVTEQQRTTS